MSNDSGRETLFESATKKLLTNNISNQPSTTSREDDLPPPPPPPPPPLDTSSYSIPLTLIQQFQQESQTKPKESQEILEKPETSISQTLVAPPRRKKLTRSDRDVYESDNLNDSTSDSESESLVEGSYSLLREEDSSSVKDRMDTTKIDLPLEVLGLSKTPEAEDDVSPEGDKDSLTAATRL